MEILVGIIALAVGLLAGWAIAATRAEARVRRAEVRTVESRALLEAERRVAAERVAAASTRTESATHATCHIQWLSVSSSQRSRSPGAVS